MRKYFVELLYSEMCKNNNIVVLIGDIGYGMWEKIEQTFPDRFVNCGSSEQLMVSMAIGASLEGKIPIVFSITSFLIYRPFEILRTYVNFEKHPIKLIGGNRGKDYINLGFSHYAHDTFNIMSTLQNIKIYEPENNNELNEIFHKIIYNNEPVFMSLKK
jgi:transketolase